MKNPKNILVLIVSALFFTGLGCATPATPAKPAEVETKAKTGLPSWATPYYLTSLPFPADQLTTPPPADGSTDDKADFKILLDCQKKRTAAQCEAAGKQSIPHLETAFGRNELKDKGLPDFSKLSPEAHEALEEFFVHAERDVGYVSHVVKGVYARKRPYERNPEINPCIKREASLSYPSGHAAFGSSGALILSDIFPNNKKALTKAGAQMGQNRILGGVHHPSDVANGAKLGRTAYFILTQSLKYQADLTYVKRMIASGKNAKAVKAFMTGKALDHVAPAVVAPQ